ncbi:hypothetical protein Tco_0008341 [Tanacetum coccineum]
MDNTNPPSPPDSPTSLNESKICKLNSFLASLNLVPPSSNTQFVCTKENDGDVIFLEIIKKYDDSIEEELEEDDNVVAGEELGVEYFDKFPTRREIAYNKYLMSALTPSLFMRNPTIVGESPLNLKIRNLTYVLDFLIVKYISLVIDSSLSQVVLRKPFVKVSNMTYDSSLGIVKFTNEIEKIAYMMPHKIEHIKSLSNMEKEHKQSVYFRSEEDKRRGVDYVIKKILRFYKECLELGPEYLTGRDGSRTNDGVT